MKKVLCGVLITLLLNGCTYIDNWMLGVDNTPKPQKLSPIAHPRPMYTRWREEVRAKPIPFYMRWFYTITGTHREGTGYFKLAPVYKSGIVYTAVSDGTLEARDANEGAIIWQNRMPTGLASGPYVSYTNLAIGGADASVFLLSRKDGRVLWHTQVSNTVLSPPVISRGRVFAKTIDGHVYAFDERSGQVLWDYYHRIPNLSLRAESTPTVIGNMVIVGFADGKLDGLNTDNGHIQWQRSITYPKGSSDIDRMIDIDATPIVRNGIIYAVSYQGHVVALSLNNGQFLWRHALSSYRNMALGDRYLYITDIHSDIWAFNIFNGSVVWRQRALHNRDLTAPRLTKRGLIFADKFGFLHIVSPVTGKLIGRMKVTKSVINARPAHHANDLYVLTEKGTLYDVRVGVK